MLYVNRNVSFSQIGRCPGVHMRWFDHECGWVPFFDLLRRNGRSFIVRHLPRVCLLLMAEGDDMWTMLGIEFRKRRVIGLQFPTPPTAVGYAWIESTLRLALGLPGTR